jgi:hypothetical protein
MPQWGQIASMALSIKRIGFAQTGATRPAVCAATGQPFGPLPEGPVDLSMARVE